MPAISGLSRQGHRRAAIAAPKSKLRPIPIGTSHDLKWADYLAIGNPFGLDQSMTIGIVSAPGPGIQSKNGSAIEGSHSDELAINPGNSGGPLLDSAGRLIGMNTAIISPSGTFAGIGFAIPVDEINQIVPELIRNGKVRPWIGVELADDRLAQQFGVNRGSLILHVAPNSPAAAAGLKGTRKNARRRCPGRCHRRRRRSIHHPRQRRVLCPSSPQGRRYHHVDYSARRPAAKCRSHTASATISRNQFLTATCGELFSSRRGSWSPRRRAR